MIFEIALKKFAVEPEQIVRAVSMLDPEGDYLSEDNVSVLQTLKAAEDETTRAMAYAGTEAQIAKLSKSEQFIIYMARERRWTTKLKAIQAIRNYRQYADRLYEMMDSVMKASAEVRDSDKFRTVLGIVLWFGNYLNQGTRRGKAKGFRLSALPKLAEVRSKEKGTTLLQYMVATTAKKEPELLTFPEEFVRVRGASKIKKEDISMELSEFDVYMKHLASETKTIVKEHNLPEQLLDGPRPNAAPVEIQKILDRYFVADKSLSELKGMYDEMVAEVKELALYLGEESRNPRSEEIFGTLSSFMESFVQCRTIVLEQQDKAKAGSKKAQERKVNPLETSESQGNEAASNAEPTASVVARTGSSVDRTAESVDEIGSENQGDTRVSVDSKSNVNNVVVSVNEVADGVGKLKTENVVDDSDLHFTVEKQSSEQASPPAAVEETAAQKNLEQKKVEQGNHEKRKSVCDEQGEENIPPGSSPSVDGQQLETERTPEFLSTEDSGEAIPETGPVRESALHVEPAPQDSAGVANGEPGDGSSVNAPQGDGSLRVDHRQIPEITMHSVELGQERPYSSDIDSEVELAETDDDFFEEDDADVWSRLNSDN
uniref:FH2 domain-containing protein n=2 Tax=Rhodosorus marinus TaxID=101924 RepID=A0A6T6KGE2_9RHOD|mmetsp:Transcript_13394/g.19301  ORF Transcript_13394/g.19301 Transcript_13394/m.19301 type:complete len:601 (+) Transcript_13394:819-2621(+)